MQDRDSQNTGDGAHNTTTGSTGETSGHSSSPQVQTPDKPSQAEGDRETIDESIREKEGAGDS